MYFNFLTKTPTSPLKITHMISSLTQNLHVQDCVKTVNYCNWVNIVTHDAVCFNVVKKYDMFNQY